MRQGIYLKTQGYNEGEEGTAREPANHLQKAAVDISKAIAASTQTTAEIRALLSFRILH